MYSIIFETPTNKYEARSETPMTLDPIGSLNFREYSKAVETQLVSSDSPITINAFTPNVVAYAVHVEGALWDDPEISAWSTSLDTTAAALKRAEGFFADDEQLAIDEPNGGLLTIVRAVFTPEEWAQVVANDWAAI